MDRRLAQLRRAEGLRKAMLKRNGSRNKAIARIYGTGKYSLREVGARFGLSQEAIRLIVAQERAGAGPNQGGDR